MSGIGDRYSNTQANNTARMGDSPRGGGGMGGGMGAGGGGTAEQMSRLLKRRPPHYVSQVEA